MPIAMLGVAWPDMRESLARGSGELGILVAGYGFGRLSTAGSSGVVLRALTFERALLLGAIALAAATAWVASGPVWPHMIGAFIAVGMSTGVLESLGSRFMAVTASARSAGLLAGAYGVGSTIGPALVALSGRWQLAYVVSSATTLLAGATLLAPCLRWPEALASPGAHGGTLMTDARPCASRPRWAVVLVSLGLFAVFVGIEATAGQWTATFLEQTRGIERRLAGMAVSSFFAGVTIGRIGLGAVDVPRRLPVSVVSLPIPLFAAVALGPPVAIPVLMFLAGLSLAPTFPMLMAATADRVGVDRAGQMSGWQMIASNAGATVFPALTGVFISLTTPAAAMVVLTLMAVAGVLLVLLAQGRPTLAAVRQR